MSLQNEIIKFVMKQRRRAMEKQDVDLLEMRNRVDELFVKTFITPWTVDISPVILRGLEAEIITPSELEMEDCIIMYVHGGGYFMGSIDTHRSLAAWVALEAGMPAVIFNYSLAPEHPFPAGRNDVVKVYGQLLEEYPAHRIAFVGDSAGGGLILQALLAMKDLDMPMPSCCCLLSPFLDLSCSSDSVEENAESDPFVVPKFLRMVIPKYIRPPYHVEHPEVNPLYADLHGLPPMLVHVGTIEVLLDDSRNLAKRCMAHGVECILDEYEGLPHVWHFNRQFFLPEAQQALKEVGDFLKERVDA